ncbi:hypothetical protein SE17_01110 [Kouleothrix aurantiaca]|uniref:site-specific DNA-methyltransferase (adenine-specific) n=1 Tax=Kouleothrix aurantiaca TaxID=186479 RepID=A0A0P9DN41_9CHLR|nr:hypothetical protein SE17_01110 [Kouleothrix aurantiaca]
MVQWLLQNSLGRSYHEAYPDSKLPESWAYYIRQRSERQTAPESPRPLETLDLIDPCCGSGHFLRESFDMFAAMYRERHPNLNAAEIADRILERHLHGIDLDPRAAQLAALMLYLRAWELVRDERRAQRQPGPGNYCPAAMNIATTPSGLNTGALQRHLRRHPEDRVMKPLLEGVFTALEKADILGSLLRPAEHIEAAMKALQQPHTVPMDFDADDAALRRTITTMARHDPAELKRMLLDRVAQSFAAESGNTDDVAAQLFGREAERGVRLLQLLDRKYAVVVTNPPYMGSGNMDMPLKKYIERHYKSGKRDLYAAFILRCLELCRSSGRVAMVTMLGWMFLRSFDGLRAVSNEKLEQARKNSEFTGILREMTVEYIGHLGTRAFEEISGEIVSVALFTLKKMYPSPQSTVTSLRAVGFEGYSKTSVLKRGTEANNHHIRFVTRQQLLLNVPGSPIIYWVPVQLLDWMTRAKKIEDFAITTDGVTGLAKLTRFSWEAPHGRRWLAYSKGGSHVRWAGLETHVTDWEFAGARQRAYIDQYYPYLKGNYGFRLKSTGILPKSVYVFSSFGKGGLGCREPSGSIIVGDKGPGVVPSGQYPQYLLSILNHRGMNFLMRAIGGMGQVQYPYLSQMPVPELNSSENDSASHLERMCVSLKRQLVSIDLTERTFKGTTEDQLHRSSVRINTPLRSILSAALYTVEAVLEKMLFAAYTTEEIVIDTILQETGTPAGFHPLIAGYDALPELSVDLELPPLPQEVNDYLTDHERISPSPVELVEIKARLRKLYEDGPGAKDDGADENGDAEGSEDTEGAVSGAHIPIPTETFLEELSVKMQIHPISVYWLLEELRAEGARCKPEEQRLLEDRLSVLVLRLLGHRWPRQIEAGEPVPAWADPDGIIPITSGAGETTLAERLRARLRAEDGDLGVQRIEALLTELTGLTLEEWVRRRFFDRHIRQFKYRPVAWHLASTPPAPGKGRKGSRRLPAFECMLYYHACGGDVLARIRTQYVDPLLRAERQRAEDARRANDETAAALATERIQELEAFAARLRHVAGDGFACPELDKLLEGESLDRWSGDGYLSPTERADLARQERAWRVDLNDGVRVNIAPVQLAGLLVSDVLKAVDARKAIADRARWRSDERRWVRAGKLPRCGWMDESVPGSQRWTELAPQRAAEKAKLEEKRRAMNHKEQVE